MELKWNLRFSLIIWTFMVVNEIKCFSPSFQSSPKNLYTQSDPILNLDSNNFNVNVYGKSQAHIIEFYASWCGHCINFAPVYKNYAAQIQNWKRVVKIAAVNCADDVNTDICRKYNVLRYPTIKFFWVNTQNNDLGLEFNSSSRSIEDLRKATISALIKHSSEDGLPTNWPSLAPLNANSKAELLKISKYHTKKPFLVLLEDGKTDFNGFLLGEQIILHVSGYTEYVDVVRVVDSSNILANEILPFGEAVLPVLLRVRNNHEIDLLERPAETAFLSRDQFIQRIEADFLPFKKQSVPTESTIASTTIAQDESQYEIVPVHMQDLYNALRYTLYNEVATHQMLNKTEIAVMKNFTHVLNRYFPFDSENARRFIIRISQWFQLRKTDSIDNEDFLAQMKVGNEGYLTRVQPYVSCQGSVPGLRGYPCSMWILFHTLTVSEFISEPQKLREPAHSVLFAMRDYIKFFFSCKHCAEHFSQLTANLEAQLNHPNSSVLWLWKAHNQVNARLKNDPTEDPKHPKIQFPSQIMCPNCFKTPTEYDENRVLEYLVNHYHKENIVKHVRNGSFKTSPIYFMISTLIIIMFIN